MRTIAECAATLSAARFIPVVTLRRPADAVPLARALLAGGLPLLEIAFRTDAAAFSIESIRAELPQVFVAAGTVLDPETVERAIDAGASFVMTPGFNPAVVDYCVDRRIPILPGVNSPSQVELARALGLRILNFFPAEASGGVRLLRAMARPYVGIQYLPSGGITPENLASYLEVPEVIGCAGSWVAPPDAIEAGRFDEIESNARAMVALIQRLSDPRPTRPLQGATP